MVSSYFFTLLEVYTETIKISKHGLLNIDTMHYIVILSLEM